MTSQIKTYGIEELEKLMADLNQPKFRAKQLYEWLHSRHTHSYDDMTNLPKSLRSELQNRFPLTEPKIVDKQVSSDGTRKYIMELDDGCLIEAVGMPVHDKDDNRLSVCISTQVGCAMGCAFCATGQEGFTRNLTADEMVDQVALIAEDFGERVTNVVAMGQGEPFLNYDEVLKAFRSINSDEALGIGARHITVSTCGIIDGIEKFSEEPEQFNLAISLHSADQDFRDILMPKVKNQPLERLSEALRHYVLSTNRRITLEYLLIDGKTDRDEDLSKLVDFCKGILCHVNLLRMNRIPDSPLQPSSEKRVHRFIHELQQSSIPVTTRRSRGSDIAGACGQLKNSFKN